MAKINFRIFLSSLLFNLFLILWTLIWGGMGMFFGLLHPKLAQKIGYIWAKVILFMLRIICNIKHEIIDGHNLKDDSYIIASKHESAWDTIFYLAFLKDPVYILKKELLFIPVLGQNLMVMGMIAINRAKGRKSIREISEKSIKIAKQKRRVVIFPQGTRTKPNAKISYKSGIYAIARDTKTPVTPIVFNSGIYWGKNAFFKFPGTIKVKILPAIKSLDNKNEFMDKLEQDMEASYKKLV